MAHGTTRGERYSRQYQDSTLVPLVFLNLPVTIAFAIFPAILLLQLGF